MRGSGRNWPFPVWSLSGGSSCMYHQGVLSVSGTMGCCVPVLRIRSSLFAEISLDARNIFQSFVTWKCRKYWNIFTASKSVCVKHVADILENRRWKYRYAAKEQLPYFQMPQFLRFYCHAYFPGLMNYCSFHTENPIYSWIGTKNWKSIVYS